MARRASAAIALVFLLFAASSHADDPRAASREDFRRGVTLVKEGKLTLARDAFEKAYAAYPHPSILLNLGIVRLRTGDYVHAEDDLSRFLVNDGGATSDEVASARAALAETRGHLGTLRLKITPAYVNVLVDGKAVSVMEGGTTELRTTTGLHDVRVTANDYDADEEHVMVTSDHVAERAVMLTPHSSSGAPDSGTTTPNNYGMPVRSILGWGLVGFAGISVVGGALCGVRAISLAGDYNDERPQNPDDRSAGVTFRAAADVLFVTAIVSGGVGAYLILTTSKAPASVAVGPAELRVRIAF